MYKNTVIVSSHCYVFNHTHSVYSYSKEFVENILSYWPQNKNKNFPKSHATSLTQFDETLTAWMNTIRVVTEWTSDSLNELKILSSLVTFIYIMLYTVKIVSKQLCRVDREMIQQCKQSLFRLYISSKRKQCHCSAGVISVLIQFHYKDHQIFN